MTGPLTGEQLVAMLDAFGHAWHCWWQSSTTDEARERGRARDEARRAIVDAYAELRTELAEARESRDRARTAWDKAREYNNKALEKFAAYERELADANTMIGSLGSQLAAVKAERDELRGIARALRITVVEMLSGKQPTAARAMVWQSTLKYATEALSADEPGESEDDNPSCQQGCGKTATSWGVCDDHMPDVPERDATPYRVWHGACPPAHFDPRWQWACKLCDAVGCGTGTEAQNRAEAEQHIATQHAERGGA